MEFAHQLYEIEAASVKIMEHAAEQKAEIAERYKTLTREFDHQVDQDTQKQLEELNLKLTAEKDFELSKLQHDTNKHMADLDRIYNEQHTCLAQEVAQRLIEE